MKFMNDYDIAYARQRFTRSSTPNRLGLVFVIDALREWADMHSDGWAYWPKPCRAAAQAIALVESRTSAENDRQEREDLTQQQVNAAVAPIKAFCTRQQREGRMTAEAREVILRGSQEV